MNKEQLAIAVTKTAKQRMEISDTDDDDAVIDKFTKSVKLVKDAITRMKENKEAAAREVRRVLQYG